jgi:hypothetical protein
MEDVKNVVGDDSSIQGSGERRGSIIVDHNLASEEDAAVLAKMG